MGALVEILQSEGMHAEWRLLLPALAAAGPGPVVLIGPPWRPFGPALAAQGLDWARVVCCDAQAPQACLWASEQALRCAEVAAVLAWLPRQVRAEPLRRLHLAAAQHAKLLFAMRPAAMRDEASPAALRLQVTPHAAGDDLAVEILKRRGPPLAAPVVLSARQGRLAAMLTRDPTVDALAQTTPMPASSIRLRGRPKLRLVDGAKHVPHDVVPALGRMAGTA